MHVSTIDILEIVTDLEKTIGINYQVMYGFSIRLLTFDLDLFKGQGQGHLCFINEYL